MLDIISTDVADIFFSEGQLSLKFKNEHSRIRGKTVNHVGGKTNHPVFMRLFINLRNFFIFPLSPKSL